MQLFVLGDHTSPHYIILIFSMSQVLLCYFLKHVYSIYLILKISDISMLSILSFFNTDRSPFLLLLNLSSSDQFLLIPCNNYLLVVWVEVSLFHYHFLKFVYACIFTLTSANFFYLQLLCFIFDYLLQPQEFGFYNQLNYFHNFFYLPFN